MSHVKIRIPSVLIIIIALIASLLALGAVVVQSSTIDITKPRLERDVASTFSNQYVHQHQLLGVNVDAPRVATTCRKGGPTVPDQGPGKDWVCVVSWTEANPSAHGESRYEVGARTEACYTATDPKLTANNQFIRNHSTGADVDNPLYQFDGCFDVT